MKTKGKKAIKVITPLTRTVKAPYSDWGRDSVVPGWDDIPGVAQHASRVTRDHPPKVDGSADNPVMKSDHPKV